MAFADGEHRGRGRGVPSVLKKRRQCVRTAFADHKDWRGFLPKAESLRDGVGCVNRRVRRSRGFEEPFGLGVFRDEQKVLKVHRRTPSSGLLSNHRETIIAYSSCSEEERGKILKANVVQSLRWEVTAGGY
jgi:hypothetical protein